MSATAQDVTLKAGPPDPAGGNYVPYLETCTVFRREVAEEGILDRVLHELANRRPRFRIKSQHQAKYDLPGKERRYTIEDALAKACEKILRGRRRWNRAKYPTLFKWIMSVAESVLNHDWPDWVGPKAPVSLPDQIQGEELHDCPAQTTANQELRRRICRKIAHRPNAAAVWAYKCHDQTAEQAAAQLGVTPARFRNVIVKQEIKQLKFVLLEEWDVYSKE